MLNALLPYIQITISVLLIVAILLQRRGTGIGAGFGGGDGLGSYAARRGLERSLFIITIVLALLFVVSSFVGLIL